MRRFLALLPAALVAAGCLDHELAPGDEAQLQSFIAMQRDFQGFQSWEAYDLGEAPAQADGGHPAGRRTIYVNELPPSGSTHFPVGTMLVKVRGDGAPQGWEVHAMVKRGGAFNEDGALGWEWFDIRMDDEARPVILWRGLAAPSGHGYGIIPGVEVVEGTTGDCNSCHGVASRNDFVMNDLLRLDEL